MRSALPILLLEWIVGIGWFVVIFCSYVFNNGSCRRESSQFGSMVNGQGDL